MFGLISWADHQLQCFILKRHILNSSMIFMSIVSHICSRHGDDISPPPKKGWCKLLLFIFLSVTLYTYLINQLQGKCLWFVAIMLSSISASIFYPKTMLIIFSNICSWDYDYIPFLLILYGHYYFLSTVNKVMYFPQISKIFQASTSMETTFFRSIWLF